MVTNETIARQFIEKSILYHKNICKRCYHIINNEDGDFKNSDEGIEFWEDVIFNVNEMLFFSRYPTEQTWNVALKYKNCGQLNGFPYPVVKQMLIHQVEQGNKLDANVFMNSVIAGRYAGGFDWDKTKLGDKKWNNITIYKKFDLINDTNNKTELNMDSKLEKIKKISNLDDYREKIKSVTEATKVKINFVVKDRLVDEYVELPSEITQSIMDILQNKVKELDTEINENIKDL